MSYQLTYFYAFSMHLFLMRFFLLKIGIKGCAENRVLFDRKFNCVILVNPIQNGMQMGTEHLRECAVSET